MVSDETQRVALLPIRPQYVRAILAGEKKVEFRRRGFAQPVSHVVIYATSPAKKVVGYFRVDHLTEATPTELWRKFEGVAGIDHDAFSRYYSGTNEGVAIGIDDLVVFEEPVPLRRISASLATPQSFCYLQSRHFEKVVQLSGVRK